MDISTDIKTRTFGVEIEMCNLDRSKVSLPTGYSWSKDEDIVMGTSTPILLAMLSNRIRPCETSSVMYLERTEVGLIALSLDSEYS